MKVDLESLAAEAELYRAGKTRTHYPIDFKKAAVSALRQHRYEVLVKRLDAVLDFQLYKSGKGVTITK
jgi:hypothetical protein